MWNYCGTKLLISLSPVSWLFDHLSQQLCLQTEGWGSWFFQNEETEVSCNTNKTKQSCKVTHIADSAEPNSIWTARWAKQDLFLHSYTSLLAFWPSMVEYKDVTVSLTCFHVSFSICFSWLQTDSKLKRLFPTDKFGVIMYNSGTKWGSSRLQFDWIQFTFLPSFSTLDCLPKHKVKFSACLFFKINIFKISVAFSQRDRLHKSELRFTKR